MAVRVALHHTTRYRYARRVGLGAQIIRLRPAPHNRTPIHRYGLTISPSQYFINWQQDPHGNHLARVVVPEPSDHLEVNVELVADLEAYSPFDFFLEPSAATYPFSYAEELAHELAPYLERCLSTPRFFDFVERLDKSRRNTVDFLVDVNRAVHTAVGYVIRMEPGIQTPEATLTRGLGSCRDSGWLLAQVLRHLGIATRFVSGYLIQLVPDQKAVDGPEGPARDFTDLHAWCECYVPGAGWIGLDPTSGLFAAEGHIPLACTPQPSSAAPISGTVESVESEFAFEMTVTRIVDRPRVTKPYAESDWQRISTLGDRVDELLTRADVRLSVGGEPTFVSSESPDAPEWNTQALGGTKERDAERLMRRLFSLWGRGGFLFHGQGKWYPGEQLPRWAHACYHRADGVPLWRDPELLARSGEDHGHTQQDAERFANGLIEALGLARHGLMPAHEDAFYYLWRERRLPINTSPLEPRLDDPLERERVRRVFAQGLNKVVGWVLPLMHREGWVSGKWFLRDDHCLLLPGDSPIGYRLPLDSLPWAAVADREDVEPRDPFAALLPLPAQLTFPRPPGESVMVRRQRRWPREGGASTEGPGSSVSNSLADPHVAPLPGESALGLVRTALCVEARGGVLRVFMPPLDAIDAYLELVAAVEHTAASLGLPVQLEGYPPPRDPRVLEFRVTPDPGVIEVNVPPTTSWRAAVEQTEQLYEAARQEKLVAEKFELDGAHIGSGGGNHLVLGAVRAEDSPFLRRPDLLGSLLRYWHNHPALSFLFSGRFIGPTSQAPRIDEARNDSVYELELALAKLPRKGEAVLPWLTDRMLRNLLVDVTGNTHRTEFCIDKLFSPEGTTGRLGLLEMRAFEMPPHERMSSLQQLLVRALLATFWERPYERELVKWGTRLHDEFMLPFYVMADLREVVSDLVRWGHAFEASWFEPHHEFRFPRFGAVSLDTLSLELRGALEPWLVLGEESTQGGQARYVDSSLERLQVLVEGSIGERWRILCNGVVVPMRPTQKNGQFVAGVRYRAWQPPSCLHPTIGVHGPLRFDIFDTWTERGVAGCTYHVTHPGGRATDVRPVNAVAAESRRLARFERHGKLGAVVPREVPTHPSFPHTLDLRWS